MKKIILLIIVLVFPFSGLAQDEKWYVSRSTHFVLYYKDVPESFINKVIERAEDYYNKITDDLGFTRYNFWLWENRAKIYIYNDIEEYKSKTGQPSWSSGCVSVKDKIIKTYPLASGFFDTLLPHELGHIIFREFVGFDNNNIPFWLDEGVASYQEMTKRFAAKRYVSNAIRDNKFIPLDRLSNINLALIQDKETVDIVYLEAVNLIDYLISQFGDSAFVNFCRALRDGKTLDGAISSTYGFKNLDELNTAWQGFLKNE